MEPQEGAGANGGAAPQAAAPETEGGAIGQAAAKARVAGRRASEAVVKRGWEVKDRFDRVLDDEERRRRLKELLMLLPNLAKLLFRLAKDPEVPLRARIFAGAAAGYLVSPIDLVPDFIPVLGKTDDLVLAALALDSLLKETGGEVLRKHWDGPEEQLSMVIDLVDMAAGVVPRPLRMALNRYLRR